MSPFWLISVPIGVVSIILLILGILRAPIQNLIPRSELPPLEIFLSQAKHEIDILGLTLENVSRQNMDSIKHALEQGVNVRVLVLNRDSPKELLSEMEDGLASANVAKAIDSSLDTLCRIKNGLPSTERNRFEIRKYDLVPVHSIVVLAPNTDDAKIQVEFRLYNTDPRSRMCLVISKKKQKELFQKYFNSYLFALGKSMEHSCQ